MKRENLERASEVIRCMDSISNSREALDLANCNRGLRIGFSEIGTGSGAWAYVQGYEESERVLDMVRDILNAQYSALEHDLEAL